MMGKCITAANVVLGFSVAMFALHSGRVRAFDVGDGERVPIADVVADSGTAGGLVVYVGSGHLELPALLRDDAPFLVHQLVCTPDRLDSIRARIREGGVDARASAMAWAGGRLPYAGEMVNLLVVSPGAHDRIADGEIERVLAPLGTAYVADGAGGMEKHSRPWPDDMDRWTHARYDATGNAVSSDGRVGPPRHVQWQAKPRWNRGTKTSSMVTDAGRLFYIMDDSEFFADRPWDRWSLVARDAFNGIELWRHELAQWPGGQIGKKVGPIQADRKLVADGGRVYAQLESAGPVSVIDGATGEVLRTLAGTENAAEILISNGVLVVFVDPNTFADIRRGNHARQTLAAFDAVTGASLWRHESDLVLPLTLAADDRQAVYHDGERIRSLDLRTGNARWTSAPTGQNVKWESPTASHHFGRNQAGAEETSIVVSRRFAPTLIIYEDVVGFAGGRRINVVSAENGRALWEGDYPASNYATPVNMFGFGGRIWGPDDSMEAGQTRSGILFKGLDVATGELLDQPGGDYGFWFPHHRCHPKKVVGNAIVAAAAGVEFLDTATGRVVPHHWTRGSCHYGVLPANGLLYVPPHDCACYVRAKLAGFYAFKAEREASPADSGERLQRGPAYGQTGPDRDTAQSDDWPTYRGDAARSGRASSALSPELAERWETQLNGELTAPVAAGGRVFVAASRTHRLYALDADTGRVDWVRTTDGPVDSPPTVYQGLAIVGGRDGWVYAFRAEDGELVWRFRASPETRLVVSEGRLESTWPVHGSVLVAGDAVYVAAGRSSYLDGGMHLYALDPHSGQVRFHRVVDSRHMGGPRQVVEDAVDDRGRYRFDAEPDGEQMEDGSGIDGFLNDILASDGTHVFMRHQTFDLAGNWKGAPFAHLHGPDGFLSGATTFRLVWTYAPTFTSLGTGVSDYTSCRIRFPSGRILVEGQETIYGFGQNHYDDLRRRRGGGRWALFSAPKRRFDPPDDPIAFGWVRDVPIHAWAMLKSNDILLVAGPAQHRGEVDTAAFAGKTSASLISVSVSDGSVLGERSLPSTPVWDGMAAANGKVFITTRDGRVLCLAASPHAKMEADILNGR